MALVDRTSPLVQYIYNLLVANRTELGLEDVFMGDQRMLPHTPAACVESGNVDRVLVGAPSAVTNNLTVYVLIYHSTIQDIQSTAFEALTFSEAIVDLLHSDLQMGGLVVHGFVTTVEPGYADRGRSWVRTVRLTWLGITRSLLSEAA